MRRFIDISREQGLPAAMRRSAELLTMLVRQTWRRWWARVALRRAVFRPPENVVPPELRMHQGRVDIVICVHDALEDVRQCLESLARNTRMPYRLILVDDGSAEPTQRYLAQFAEGQPTELIRNETARGYTLAANQGLRCATGDYVVLLNSDTVVSSEWLDRMITCADSDAKIGLVGPLSNTASWQSIPEILNAEGDWADNALPESLSADDLARLAAKSSDRLYPRVSFLNGFCLLVKRQVLNAIGLFDEEAFGRGYGEENDYCLRARRGGWQLAVADDVYIYHAQSRSYSHARRRELSDKSNQALVAKYGERVVGEAVRATFQDRVLEGVRARARVMIDRQRLIEAGLKRWPGKRVLFLLPLVEVGGGGNVVFQEAAAMQRMGVEAHVLNLSRYRGTFQPSYGDQPVPLVYIEEPQQVRDLLWQYDAVIATSNISVDWMDVPASEATLPVRGYYIQDFEPYFYAPGSAEHQVAWQSYGRFPDLVRFTKTEWNRDRVRSEIGVDSVVVGPSVDIDLYRPRLRRDGNWPERPLRIAAMVRPLTPRRQPAFTMEVLRDLHRARGRNVDIILFGCDSKDQMFLDLPRNFAWRNAGVLNRPALASLLNEVDIFVDFSLFQAMGLTALEAMAVGAAVIVPKQGGSWSFAQPEANCLVVETTSRADCLQALRRLSEDAALRQRLQSQGLADSAQFFPEKAAYNILATLFPDRTAPL